MTGYEQQKVREFINALDEEEKAIALKELLDWAAESNPEQKTDS